MNCRIFSIWSWSAPPTKKTNCAYAERSIAPRVISPPARKGLLKASELDLAMIVLSRSKKAAVARVSTLLIVGEQRALPGAERPGGCPQATLRQPVVPRDVGDPLVPRRGAGSVDGMSAPLVVTRDASLLDELLRLAAAAGVTPRVCGSVTDALAAWSAAPLVLLGADVAGEMALLRPGRRDATHVVVAGPVPDDLFAVALSVGAESVAELPRSEAWLVEVLTDAGDRAPSRGRGRGRGRRQRRCRGDDLRLRARPGRGPPRSGDRGRPRPAGPGLDRVLGLEQRDGVRWDALQQTTGRLSARSLHDAVPPARRPRRAHLAARSERLGAAVRGAGGAVGRAAGATTWWSSTCPRSTRRPRGRGGRRAATCWWW